MKDRDVKGRCAQGENHYKAKLTTKQVKQIRILNTTGKYLQRELAKLYNVDQTSIHYILSNHTWKGVGA